MQSTDSSTAGKEVIFSPILIQYLGFIDKEEQITKCEENKKALDGLRQGMFAPKNRGKLVEKTEEGIPVSMNLLEKGFIANDEMERFPLFFGANIP